MMLLSSEVKQAAEHPHDQEDADEAGAPLHQREHHTQGDHDAQKGDIAQVVHFSIPLSGTGINSSRTRHMALQTPASSPRPPGIAETIISAMQSTA